MRRKDRAFTMVELLTVLAIIAMLVGVLIPTLKLVRNISKETAQKAQFATIEMALMAFKNDYGSYPPSYWSIPPNRFIDTCGVQKLSEALLGWDLLGFHPQSAWRADGRDVVGNPGTVYDMTGFTEQQKQNNLQQRMGPYLELATTNVFRLGDLFGWNAGDTVDLKADTFVICDVFKTKRIVSAGGQKTVSAGTPILYYRADTSRKTIDYTIVQYLYELIFNAEDNLGLISLGVMTDKTPRRTDPPYGHPFGWEVKNLYNSDHGGDVGENGICGIRDSRILPPAPAWPHRPDSYILISAGADGLYGTRDDIRNF